jgi:nitrate/nitrite transport system substrate-binding protein
MKMAETVSAAAYIDTSVDVINQRILGRYQDGMGRTWDDANHMKFYNDGLVPFPFLSDGMWFMTQQRRWGLLKKDPDYAAVARAVNRTGLYAEAATQVHASVPASPMRTSRLIDGTIWSGVEPARVA